MTYRRIFTEHLVRRARFNDSRVHCAMSFWKGIRISLDAWLRAIEDDALMVRRETFAP